MQTKGNVLITGASTGIGKASAKKFIEENYSVWGSVRSENDASLLQEELGENFTPLIFDVRYREEIERAREKYEKKAGGAGLACLINNAGIAIGAPLLHITDEEMSYQLDVNVTGLLRVTQVFAPLLGATKPSPHPAGTLINISSLSGLITRPFFGPYAASKYAVEAVSDALRRELTIYGIKVIIVEPGPIDTKIWKKAREEKPRYQDTDYAAVFSNQDKYLDMIDKISIPVERVSDLIYKSFTSKNPKTRYFISPKRWIFWAAAHLFSDKMMDRMFEKQINSLIGK